MAGVFCLLVCHPHRGRCRFMGGQVICSVATSYQFVLWESGLSCKARRLISCQSHTKARPVLGKAI